MYDLKKTELRIQKILATLRQYAEDNKNLRKRLSTRDEPLVQKVKKLEGQIAGFHRLHEAQENVLRAMQQKLDKYEPEDSSHKKENSHDEEAVHET